jgi:hypothetical protein
MYRAEMGVPPMPDEGAPGPMNRRKRMGNLNIDPKGKLTAEDRRMLNPVLEPVPGEEVGMEERKSKVYKKMEKMSAGGYTKAADGCAQRGKTRGKFV